MAVFGTVLVNRLHCPGYTCTQEKENLCLIHGNSVPSEHLSTIPRKVICTSKELSYEELGFHTMKISETGDKTWSSEPNTSCCFENRLLVETQSLYLHQCKNTCTSLLQSFSSCFMLCVWIIIISYNHTIPWGIMIWHVNTINLRRRG